jgi:YD repeat-containing protein
VGLSAEAGAKAKRDWQNRVTREVRANGTTDTLYTYDVTGRLKTVTDPKDQVTTHTYATDDSLLTTAYTNATIPTPGVTAQPVMTAMARHRDAGAAPRARRDDRAMSGTCD